MVFVRKVGTFLVPCVSRCGGRQKGVQLNFNTKRGEKRVWHENIAVIFYPMYFMKC